MTTPDSSVEQPHDREVAAERVVVGDFVEGMMAKQPQVVAERLDHIAQQLSEKTDFPVSVDQLRSRVGHQVDTRMSALPPDKATTLAELIRGEELNANGGIWKEAPNPKTALGKVAASHRQMIDEILCEVVAADIAAEGGPAAPAEPLPEAPETTSSLD